MSAPIQTRRRGLVADAERSIRRLILSGEITAGTRLQQEQLAEMLGMSVTPVREAFVGLASDGWIVAEPHRGAFVRPITRESIKEHSELTLLLFDFIIKRAIERRDPAGVSRLLMITEELRHVSRPDEIWAKLREFNVRLCEIGETTRARTLLRGLGYFVLDNVFEMVPQSGVNAYKTLSGIAEAVRDGDAARGCAVLRMYLNAHLEELVDRLTERGVIVSESGSRAARTS